MNRELQVAAIVGVVAASLMLTGSRQTTVAPKTAEIVKQQPKVTHPLPRPKLVVKKKQKKKAKAKPKKRATATQRRPTAAQCAQITIGMNTIGRDGVIREGVRRGYSTAQVERALRDCGY